MDLALAVAWIAERLAGLFASVRGEPEPTRAIATPAPLLAEGDVLSQLQDHRPGLFLGVFDEPLVWTLLEQNGVLAALHARLGADVRLRIDAGEGVLRLYRADMDPSPDAVAVEVKARMVQGVLDRRAMARGFPGAPLLMLDWLVLQDPKACFRPDRPPLPGQRFPGLGLANEVVGSLVRAAHRMQAAGLAGTPMHYHLAVMYRRVFAFADPVVEGRFQAARRALAGLSLAEATHAIEGGRLRCRKTGEAVSYRGRAMVLPLADEVRAYFAHPSYAEEAAAALAELQLEVVPADATPARGSGSGSGPGAGAETGADEGDPAWPPTSK